MSNIDHFRSGPNLILPSRSDYESAEARIETFSNGQVHRTPAFTPKVASILISCPEVLFEVGLTNRFGGRLVKNLVRAH